MTDNGSDWIKQANETAALSLWHSYCDTKMELENANDRIEQLEIEEKRSYRNLTHAMKNIEKLEAALRTIYECCDETGNCSVVRRIVRKALEGKDE